MDKWNKYNTLAKFIRTKRKAANLTQVALADITGVGLRFLREMEQGKPNLRTDKVNQVLLFFGHVLTPTPISDETRRSLAK